MSDWKWTFHFSEFDIDVIATEDEDEDIIKELYDMELPYFRCGPKSYWINSDHIIFVERSQKNDLRPWEDD
jgi:hypothetical protein